MTNAALFLSLRPRHADAILTGAKTVELRRTRPQVEPGASVLLYAASPTMALVGRCVVRSVQVARPRDLWARLGDAAAVSRAEFDEYFHGAERAVGIVVGGAVALEKPVSLRELRHYWPGFQPPQIYRYVPDLWNRPVSREAMALTLALT